MFTSPRAFLAENIAKTRILALSAADPLNLQDIIIAGPRIPALTKSRLLFRGVPIAALEPKQKAVTR